MINQKEVCMDFAHLQQHYQELLDYLRKDGYTKSYIQRIQENMHWILKNGKHRPWQSYLDAYHDRVCKSGSRRYKRDHRVAFGAIQQFDLYGKFPNRKKENPLVKRGAYHQLITEFKEVIDFYRTSSEVYGLKETTVYGNASGASCFFLAMQMRGIKSLGCIGEQDVSSFFLDDEGVLSKCSSYKKKIAAVFKVAAGWKEECKTLLACLPPIRSKRKNVQFLTPDELQSVRAVIADEKSGLSLRDKAIAKLLFFTGMRACDIAEMRLDSIDWEAEEICLSQQKTGEPLTLPLTTIIGNSIFDYLVCERPGSEDDHLFLGSLYPHYPLEPGALWHHAAKIYKKAGIRQKKGERQGTHLFRHNVATSFLGNNISQPVISKVLGHADSNSLDPYLHADLINLKKCALGIERFPVSEEVFRP
jgi:integrase